MKATTRHESRADPDIDAVLEVLGDEYACQILGALENGPRPAAELAEDCGMSRATAYRRLEELETVGFVTAEMAYDADGHHRKRFQLSLEELRLEVGENGVDGSVSLSGQAAD